MLNTESVAALESGYSHVAAQRDALKAALKQICDLLPVARSSGDLAALREIGTTALAKVSA